LQRQISSGNAKVEGVPGGVRVVLLSDELFNTGTTVLSDTGKVLLAAAEDILKEASYKRIVVEGHTDNQPIVRMPYPDNWELGAARASEVVRWLASRPGIGSGKIVAQSHSSHAPIATNNTAEGRRQNRRVEILIELEGGD
ncbi:MAG: OmpA family protein, partial [Candidatus Sumerlaeia bacterium]|nr:OmpA family protein [Candidatus Sumerlaeia bacterium]